MKDVRLLTRDFEDAFKMPFRPYELKTLPKGFQYPDQLTPASEDTELYPWVFIDPASAVGQLAWKVRRSDGRNLVPFASVEEDRKDIACFDGDDLSGNPAVLILVVDGSGRQYSFSDFSAWKCAAEEDAAAWRRDYGSLR